MTDAESPLRPGQARSGAVWITALRRSGENVPRAVAFLVWLEGLLSLVSALMPQQRHRLSIVTDYFGETVISLASGTTAAVGIAMLLLASGLRRRQRNAWLVALVLSLAVTALHVLKGLDIEEAITTSALAVLLIVTRRQFGAATGATHRRRVLPIVLGLVLADVVIGLLMLKANSDEVVGEPTLAALLKQVTFGLVGVQGPLRFSDPAGARLVPAVLAGLGAITFLVGLILLLARPHKRPSRTPEQENALWRLLETHGDRDSLGWFATRDDRDLVLSPSAKAAVSYRVVGGVALAAGDPIGDPEAWPQAIDAFLTAAARNAWVPAVMGCGERAGAAWAKAGLDILELGDEAVVDTTTFSLLGRSMRGVRQAVARVDRAGHVIEVRRASDVSKKEWTTVLDVSKRWRAGEVERGFSMALGRLGDPRDRDGVLVTLSDDGGQLRALLSFAPWGKAGLSLDVMRPDREADNGVNESDDREAAANGARPGCRAGVAELRGLPVGAGAGRRAGRRAGRACLAAAVAARLPVVADRAALPVQRQVRSGVGPAVSVLSRRPGAAPGRRCRVAGGGVPGATRPVSRQRRR